MRVLLVRIATLLPLLVTVSPSCVAQGSPQALASLVLDRFQKGTESEFAAVYPFRGGRETVAMAIRGEFDRVAGLQRVIREQGDRAIMLLSGVPRVGNSGDETMLGRGFSGVYEAGQQGGDWKLLRSIPLEELGGISAHMLMVKVRPAYGLEVEDRLQARVKGQWGFVARLNHSARIEKVAWRGGGLQYAFGGGLLWVDVPEGQGELLLRYSIEVEEGPNNSNSGCFLRKAGHVRNQYFWHPFFDFNSAADQAQFQVEARIPKEYQLSTSVPQTERVEASERIVVGKSARPTFALTLVYDKDWQIVSEGIGNIRLELFIGPQFRPSESVIVKEFTDNYGLLSRRFGSPQAGYFGVVEARSKEGNGWHFASNQVVVAAGRPRVFAVKDGRPRAFFGHEVGHLWTQGTGPAANFLSEGWATYVESVILEQKYGVDIAKLYWKNLAEEYFSQFDGKLSLLEDENNSGIAYQKGAWVFRMLELAVGPTNFDRAMTEFSWRSLERPADSDELAECFDRLRVPEFDARAFLVPWLKEKYVPRLSTRIDGKRVTISQTGAQFRLPMTVEVTTAQGTQRRMLWLQDKDTIVDWPDEPQAVTLDPDQQLLVRRN